MKEGGWEIFSTRLSVEVSLNTAYIPHRLYPTATPSVEVFPNWYLMRISLNQSLIKGEGIPQSGPHQELSINWSLNIVERYPASNTPTQVTPELISLMPPQWAEGKDTHTPVKALPLPFTHARGNH